MQIYKMVRRFPTFRSERKKRSTSGGSPRFPNGFSGQFLFHLTFNRNFRICRVNGRHPGSLFTSSRFLSCRCPVKTFHFYVVSALQFIVFVFYFWLIRAVSSSYVHQQHFRPRSLAFICHSRFGVTFRSFRRHLGRGKLREMHENLPKYIAF